MKIKFDGEYKNDLKWNGKGYDALNNIAGILNNGNGKIKEYNEDGKLEFEGEYLNDKKNGFGKNFYENGNIEFEGEFKDGLKNGKGKKYDYDGNLIFEGEFLNGKKINGKGFDESGNELYPLPFHFKSFLYSPSKNNLPLL